MRSSGEGTARGDGVLASRACDGEENGRGHRHREGRNDVERACCAQACSDELAVNTKNTQVIKSPFTN